MGEAFKARSPLAQYFGIELVDAVAEQARAVLDGVLCANIEDDLTLPMRLAPSFDALVFGDVLEHLRDPWQVLSQLRQYIEPGGSCIACIPNVAHWSLISGLLGGKWDYADAGLLDRTHLRFFTLASAVAMFQKAGWTVIDATPRIFAPEKIEQALKTLLPAATALGVTEATARMNLSTLQWVVRATNGLKTKPITIASVGLKKVAGVTEARVDYPMLALQSLPEARTLWGEGSLSLPKEPGILVLHRHFMADPAFRSAMETLVARGWILVSDIDDDPHQWAGYVESDFYAFRGVHAVTVSTEHLASVIRQFNPNVHVFANAILSLPHKESQAPPNSKLRIFFGALNRKADWQVIMPGVRQAALELGDRVEFIVVHDKEFFDALPEGLSKTYLPTLGVDQYMKMLASCDVALLPLNDTTFNRCKSDIKLIECAAAGVAVICSKVVYSLERRHLAFSHFATTSQEWRDAILKLACDLPLVHDMVGNALSYVKTNRMHAQQAPHRLEVYKSLIESRPVLESQRRVRLAQMTGS